MPNLRQRSNRNRFTSSQALAGRRFRVEALEPRWLLSATPTALALAAAGNLMDEPSLKHILTTPTNRNV